MRSVDITSHSEYTESFLGNVCLLSIRITQRELEGTNTMTDPMSYESLLLDIGKWLYNNQWFIYLAVHTISLFQWNLILKLSFLEKTGFLAAFPHFVHYNCKGGKHHIAALPEESLQYIYSLSVSRGATMEESLLKDTSHKWKIQYFEYNNRY